MCVVACGVPLESHQRQRWCSNHLVKIGRDIAHQETYKSLSDCSGGREELFSHHVMSVNSS